MFEWIRSLAGRTLAAPPVEPAPAPFKHLRPGRSYRVVRDFVDHDGLSHAVGDSWTFLRSNFLPYQDGLSLFVATPHGQERQIRLQWRPEAQGPVIDALDEYVAPVADSKGRRTLIVTRDSVCMGDDVDAPHSVTLDVERDADAVAIARAILAAGYLAWVGSAATWSLAVGADRVVLGYRGGVGFVRPLGPGPLTERADTIGRVHVDYLAQIDPDTL